MKKFSLILTVLLLCAATASADILFVATPNGKTVNMRNGAGKKHSVVTKVPHGHIVNTDEDFDLDSWVACTYGDYTGYIDGKYLSACPVTLHGYKVDCHSATVKSSAHLYEKPNKKSKSIVKYAKGEELFVLRTNGTWSLVYNPASCDTGFVQSSALKRKEELDIAEVVNCFEAADAMLIAAKENRTPGSNNNQKFYDENGNEYVPTYPTEDNMEYPYQYDEYGAYMPAHPTVEEFGVVNQDTGMIDTYPSGN